MKTPQGILAMMNATALSYRIHKDDFDGKYERKDVIGAAEAQRKFQTSRSVFTALFQVMHERSPLTEEIKTVDIGLGKCKKDAYCGEWAVTSYNDDLPVCRSCQNSLEREFEREYQ